MAQWTMTQAAALRIAAVIVEGEESDGYGINVGATIERTIQALIDEGFERPRTSALRDLRGAMWRASQDDAARKAQRLVAEKSYRILTEAMANQYIYTATELRDMKDTIQRLASMAGLIPEDEG